MLRLLDNQVGAILWAQWRAIFNFYPREGAARLVITVGFSLLWYLMVAAGAVAIAVFLPLAGATLVPLLQAGLLIGFLYWQVVPVLLVSTGVSLELKKLLVYPVPPRSLFGIEVLLRLTTGIEVVILMTGAAVGLWRHPHAPFWGPLVFVPYAVLNMMISAGIRDLLSRWLSRKYFREALVFFIVLMSALPQLLVTLFPPESWSKYRDRYEAVRSFWSTTIPWPWTVTGALAAGQGGFLDALALLGWLVLGGAFGFLQFQRGLRFDSEAARARERVPRSRAAESWVESLYRLPGRLLPDPLGILVEKDLRFLLRAPRFRLVFFMGFSFGLIIWLPLLLRTGGAPEGVFAENFLAVVSLYACLLLGEVLFWNSFGFDRQAAQAYYVLPVRFSTVLLGKNLTALFFLFLEITLVVSACALLGLRYPPAKILESFTVTLLLALFLLAAGNLASVHFPRPINPGQNWRHSNAGRVQLYMLLLYPLMSVPIVLAYLARYAFETQFAFYAVIGAGLLVGAIFYYVAMDSAVQTAERRKELILEALSRSDGPMA